MPLPKLNVITYTLTLPSNDKEIVYRPFTVEEERILLTAQESDDSKDILLVENTSEEIRDLVIEMDERLNDSWKTNEDDELLQQKFWSKFLTDELDSGERRLHGVIKSRFGASFLRHNQWWLE